MRNRALSIVALVGGALVLSGCGSGASKSTNSQSTGTSASAHTSTSGSPGAGGSESSKSPERIVADAAAALRDAHGYVMQGTMAQNGKPLRLRVLDGGTTSVDLTFSAGGATAEIVTLPTAAYVRGNALFWTAHLGARGNTLASRWLQIPAANAQAITSSLGRFAPATLARCLAEDHGTLSIAGQVTIHGRVAILIKDAGNVPGSSPGILAVATSGPAYPLRATQTGPQQPGGRIDVCNDGRPNDARGALTFSRFGAVPAIHAPQHVARLGQSANA